MFDSNLLRTRLHFLEEALIAQIESTCEVVSVEASTVLIRTGQYVKVVPIVLDGLIKVMTQHEDKEYLLYYIKPSESCLMSLTAGIKRRQSLIEAITEIKSDILLIPADQIQHWLDQFPKFNKLFYQQYEDRYTDMIETVHHLLFDKLDKRIYHYLVEKSQTLQTNPIRISHRQIAQDLGTAREVVTRVMKQLERDEKVRQWQEAIEIL
jgi:CRP/FNR family transcriptional regulator